MRIVWILQIVMDELGRLSMRRALLQFAYVNAGGLKPHQLENPHEQP